MKEQNQYFSLVGLSLIVLAGFLMWHPAGQTLPPPSSECGCLFCNAASTGNPQKQGTVSATLPSVGNRAASKSSFSSGLRLQDGQLRSKPATEPVAAGKVVATVNGEPIYESELLASLPDDAFQAQSDDLKETKLNRLIEKAVQWQFLKDRKVTLSDGEFENATTDFKAMVKTPGCPCCGGGYTSVEQYMNVNAISPDELHQKIVCDGGLKLYAAQLAKEQTSPQALAETVKRHRAQIEKDCAMTYAMSFEYMRDPAYFRDEKTARARIEKVAKDALARLKKGDSFEKVANDISEDVSAVECVPAHFLDLEVRKVLGSLEPGELSPVIKTDWGCCIVKPKKMTDEDILSVAKEQAKTSAGDQMYQELDAWRKRAKIEYSAAYAPRSAPVKRRDK